MMATIGPMATSARPALSSLRCTCANARNDPASPATPGSTHPQRGRLSASVASVSSLLCPTSCSNASVASASPMTYSATGQARPRRARHGFGVVMLLRAAPASGRGRERERLGAASAMAAALPIPLVEPVTSAVLPFSRWCLSDAVSA
jgi:hypothetical protein